MSDQFKGKAESHIRKIINEIRSLRKKVPSSIEDVELAIKDLKSKKNSFKNSLAKISDKSNAQVENLSPIDLNFKKTILLAEKHGVEKDDIEAIDNAITKEIADLSSYVKIFSDKDDNFKF
jgi:DNA repair ATPase RecN